MNVIITLIVYEAISNTYYPQQPESKKEKLERGSKSG